MRSFNSSSHREGEHKKYGEGRRVIGTGGAGGGRGEGGEVKWVVREMVRDAIVGES